MRNVTGLVNASENIDNCKMCFSVFIIGFSVMILYFVHMISKKNLNF